MEPTFDRILFHLVCTKLDIVQHSVVLSDGQEQAALPSDDLRSYEIVPYRLQLNLPDPNQYTQAS